MATLQNVIKTGDALTKDEFIGWVVDYRELNEPLTYNDEYKIQKEDDNGYKEELFNLTIEGNHFTLSVEFYEGNIFEVGQKDYTYDEDGELLIDELEFPEGTIYAQSIQASLYNDVGVLVEQVEYFDYGYHNDWEGITFYVNDDNQHLMYNGLTGFVDKV